MIPNNRWEADDKAALRDALVALKTCPKCRRALRSVQYREDFSAKTDDTMLGCVTCDTVYPITGED